jgi:hypothetical protein
LWVSPAGVEEPAQVYPAGRRVGGRHEEGKVLHGVRRLAGVSARGGFSRGEGALDDAEGGVCVAQ